MKRLFVSLGLFVVLALTAYAAPSETALNSLWAYGRERGQQDLSRVVGVVGFFGQDQPKQWLLLSADPKIPGLMHEFVVRGGRVVAERHFQRPPDQDLPYIPLAIGSVKVDSNRAFSIAETVSRRAGVGFDSVHFQLRCRDLRNEPIWVLNLVDQRKSVVGVLYLSALNGDVLRAVWHRPGTKFYTDAQEQRGLFGRVKDRVTNFGGKLFNKDKTAAAAPPPPPQNYTAAQAPR